MILKNYSILQDHFHSNKEFLESGHLSNEDAAKLMNQVIIRDKKIWVVGHISEDCNDIFDIEKAIVGSL